MTDEQKHPGGRPTKYTPEYCEQLIQHFEDGLSFESFGGVIGIAVSNLYIWLDKHPEFQEAKKIGEAKSRLWWEKTGNQGLWDTTDYEDGKPVYKKTLNSTVWIFNMKNRFGWKDKQEISGNAEQPFVIKGSLDIKTASDEQLMELANKLTQG